MQLYRIAKTRYINDMSGAGARANGGRWNRVGASLVYTSTSRALATVEYLVHVPLGLAPRNLSLASITVLDDATAEIVTEEMLPKDWRRHPAPAELATIGTLWLQEARSLLLQVPSAVVEGEHNMLINPSHPAMRAVRVAATKPYQLDERLMR